MQLTLREVDSRRDPLSRISSPSAEEEDPLSPLKGREYPLLLREERVVLYSPTKGGVAEQLAPIGALLPPPKGEGVRAPPPSPLPEGELSPPFPPPYRGVAKTVK